MKHLKIADWIANQCGNHTTIVTITTSTIPKTLKTCPFTKLTKRSTINGIINFRYESTVNRQRLREDLSPNFIAEPRTWGLRLKGPIIEHKGKVYMEIKVQNVLNTAYFNDEQEIPPEMVRPWLYKHAETSRQGVKNIVILRDYAIESIKSITIKGVNLILQE